jgi:hypothetical protein
MPGTPGTPASTGARRSEGTTMTAAPCFIHSLIFMCVQIVGGTNFPNGDTSNQKVKNVFRTKTIPFQLELRAD